LQGKQTETHNTSIKIGESNYLPICLESEASDSHTTNNNWKRLHEIYPPENSIAKIRGYGFGYAIALNQSNLVIDAYDYKSILKGTFDKKENVNHEIYTTSLNNKNKTIKEIKIPEVNLNLREINFLGNKIALVGRKKNDYHLLLVNPTTIIVEQDIVIPRLKSIIKLKDLDVDSNNELLLIGFKGVKLSQNPLYLVNKMGKVEQIMLDRQTLDNTSNLYNSVLTSTTITKNFMLVTSAESPFWVSKITMWKLQPKASLISTSIENGLFDTKDDSILISVLPTPGFDGNISSDHLFVQANENQVITKSEIRWERLNKKYAGFYIPTFGVMNSYSLILSAYGTVVSLPIKNIPNSYTIKHSICRRK